LNCGGAGPNICGSGTCTPDCTNKACGASDDCQGVCSSGPCAPGLHCSAGKCVCDSTSCKGCCNGALCEKGLNDAFCGSGGATCVSCPASQGCAGYFNQKGGGFCASPSLNTCISQFAEPTNCTTLCGYFQRGCAETCTVDGGTVVGI